MLGQRQNAFVLRRYSDPVHAVDMQHTVHILARRVNGAMNRETGRVDVIRAVEDLLAPQIHFHHAGGRDFAEHQSVRIDQEMMFRPRDAGRNVRENQVVPAEHRHQAVAGREVNPLLPFRRADGRTQFEGLVIHGFLPPAHRK